MRLPSTGWSPSLVIHLALACGHAGDCHSPSRKPPPPTRTPDTWPLQMPHWEGMAESTLAMPRTISSLCLNFSQVVRPALLSLRLLPTATPMHLTMAWMRTCILKAYVSRKSAFYTTFEVPNATISINSRTQSWLLWSNSCPLGLSL